MNKKSDIVIVGDVHAHFGLLNSFINKKKPAMIIACGDFGYWPGTNHWSDGCIKTGNTKIHWCDGNHENFIHLKKRTSDEVQSNVFYQPRGSTITLPDGRIVLFMGGAYSIDYMWRTEGVSVFRNDECINMKDVDNALKNDHVDIVISHTAPDVWDMGRSDKNYDWSRKALTEVLNHFKPKLWYFGHWHHYTTGAHDFGDGTPYCHWKCLNKIPDNNWWCNIDG